MSWGFLIAGVLCAAWTAVHAVMGGREVARPLLASSLPDVPKWTQYYCWHLVTLAIAWMAGAFLWAAFDPAARSLGAGAMLLSAGFALWGVALPPMRGLTYRLLPQGWLFVPVAAGGLAGLWGI